ncbi:MAG: hypothetical protein KDA25_00480, partial [Phycisphaerales bacterium]|nr:hypothetical protein [Phycisphaerales bacterium]
MTHTMTTTTARRRFTRIPGPITGLAFGLAGAMLISPVGAEPAPAADDVLMQALVDELGRSMTLQLGDLQAPYFVQYHVQETETYQMAATYGAIVTSDDASSRRLAT